VTFPLKRCYNKEHSAKNEVIKMMYEDKRGRLLHPDDVDMLSPWEIEELGIHVYGEL